MTEVAVVSTGLANTASVVAALARLGSAPVLTRAPETVRTARAVIVPGVGAFGPGMRSLRDAELAEVLRERIAADRPTAGICLGLQLLATSSDETPGVEGLGAFSAHVARFPGPLAVPQMGWNQVRAPDDARVVRSGYAYFANSYRIEVAPPGWTAAMADYGGPFVAAVERGTTLGCQFHPELSGAWGLQLLRRWLQQAGVRC